MAIADASLIDNRARGGAYLQARLATLLKWAVALWIFAGSVVITMMKKMRNSMP